MKRRRLARGRISGGFHYRVDDAQLTRFQSASVGQRLAWLEEMREFTWRVASATVRERWRRLRRGDPIA